MIAASLLVVAMGLQGPGAATQDVAELVSGYVVDEDGQAVAGATVELIRSPNGFSLEDPFDVGLEPRSAVAATVHADDHGSFRVSMPRGPCFALRARADDHRASRLCGPVAAGDVVELQVVEVGKVSGRVVVPDRIDVTAARIDVIEHGERQALAGLALSVGVEALLASVAPDEHGRFEVTAPRGARLSVCVDHPTGAVPAWLTVAPTTSGQLVVGDFTRHGHVVHDGKPIAGARVSVSGSDLAVASDSNGAFTISARNDEPLTAQVVAAGYRPFVWADRGASHDDLECSVAPSPTVRLRLLDSDGSPIERRAVALVGAVASPNHTTARVVVPATTDAEGRLVLDSVPEGDSELWLSSSEGLLPVVEVRGEDDADLGDVHVPHTHAVEGLVESADGTKSTATTVFVEPLRSDGRPLEPLCVLADRDGRFRCPGLVTDRVRVWATTVDAYAPWQTVERAAAESLELHLRRCRTIAGVVRHPDGTPAAGAWLIAVDRGAGTPGQTAWTDTEGRFRMAAPGSVGYAITALSFGDGRGFVPWVMPGIDDLVVDLRAQPNRAGRDK